MAIGFSIIINGTKMPQQWTGGQQICYKDTERNREHLFYYQTIEKFSKDKLFTEDEKYIYGIDGPILNLSQLKKEYQEANWRILFLKLYKKHQQYLPTILKGDYCGFIYDKQQSHLWVFNNPAGTRRMYYGQSGETFVLGASLLYVSQFFQAKKESLSLNRFAAYTLLTYGAMAGTQTCITDVWRLHAGEGLIYNKNKIQTQRYVDYNDNTLSTESETTLTKQVDELFLENLRLEMDKDLEYGYDSIGTLSGGLDSRMVIMLAHKLGYRITPFCFAQEGYLDETIAHKVAEAIGEKLFFLELKTGDHLRNYEENLESYDALSTYIGSAHFDWSLKKMALQFPMNNTGMIHTGMIGDGIFGGGLSGPYLRPANPRLKLTSATLYPRIESEMIAMAKNYASEESFFLYNRVFNLAISGTFICKPYGYHSTPFMEADFMKLLLRVPPEMKYFHKLYLGWINKYHPEVTRFTWERTRMRPNARWKTTLSRYTLKLEQIYRKFAGQMDQYSMAPYEMYLDKNPAILNFFTTTFQSKIELLAGDPQLMADAKQLFTTGNISEKAMVLTLLGAVDRYHLKV